MKSRPLSRKYKKKTSVSKCSNSGMSSGNIDSADYAESRVEPFIEDLTPKQEEILICD